MSAVKFSFYNILFDACDKHYIYNTLSTAIAQIDDKTYFAVKENDVASVDTQFIDEMLSQRFMVDCQDNESDEYMYFYNRIRFGRSAKALSINFIFSYLCNLVCPYCLQGQDKSAEKPSFENIDKILSFASNTIENSIASDVAINRIFIHLYGGEPMLQKQYLIYFCDRINDIAEKYQCEITYSMTSNMTLLDDDIIALMKKYQISVQVSIDGTKEQHDKRRMFANGSGTYSVILENLKKLSNSGLKELVVIRLNIDNDNLKDAENIFTAVREYSTDIYFGFLETFKGQNDMFSSQCLSKDIYPEIVAKTFNDIYLKYERPVPANFGKMAPCAMNCENKFFIDSFLNVYKCELLLNQLENRVGFIDGDGQLVKTAGFYKQMNRTPQLFPKCMECKLLPLCAGGCAAKAYINDGNINKYRCEFTEEELIVYLKDYVRTGCV